MTAWAWAVLAWLAVLPAAEAAREPCPVDAGVVDLVWLPSKPYSGSHLLRRLVEAATNEPTYSIYPEHAEHTPSVRLSHPVDSHRPVLASQGQVATSSARNERHRARHKLKLYQQPWCVSAGARPRHWLLLKTHNDRGSTRPHAELAAAFASVRVLRLLRNPFDSVMRLALGDLHALRARVRTTAAPVASDRQKAVAKLATRYSDWHRFWDHYTDERWVLNIKYEALCAGLDTLRASATAALDFVLAGQPAAVAAAIDRAQLEAALHLEVAAVDGARQLGKHSTQLRHRTLPDGTRAFDLVTFRLINDTTHPTILRHGYVALAEQFRREMTADGRRHTAA